MNKLDLVTIQNNQVVVSSRQVAENFEKEHRNVIRDIETILEGMLKIEQTPLFQKTSYIHEQNNQEYTMYLMNRDGFSLLAMGFTGSKALQWKLKYIEAFNKMEEKLKEQPAFSIPQTFAEALKLAATLQEKIEKEEHKVNFVNEYVSIEDTHCLRDTLKTLGFPEKKTIKFLISHGILYRSKEGLRPIAAYHHKGYFKVTTTMFNERTLIRTRVTPKGMVWLAKYLDKYKTHILCIPDMNIA